MKEISLKDRGVESPRTLAGHRRNHRCSYLVYGQSQGLGGEFWRSVDRALSKIEENPLRFGKSEFAAPDLDLRFAYVDRFKYVVHFAIDVEEVLVVAVTHAVRKPGFWLSRVRT